MPRDGGGDLHNRRCKSFVSVWFCCVVTACLLLPSLKANLRFPPYRARVFDFSVFESLRKRVVRAIFAVKKDFASSFTLRADSLLKQSAYTYKLEEFSIYRESYIIMS